MTRAEQHAEALAMGIALAQRHFLSPECPRRHSEAWATLIAYAQKALGDLERDITKEQVAV